MVSSGSQPVSRVESVSQLDVSENIRLMVERRTLQQLPSPLPFSTSVVRCAESSTMFRGDSSDGCGFHTPIPLSRVIESLGGDSYLRWSD